MSSEGARAHSHRAQRWSTDKTLATDLEVDPRTIRLDREFLVDGVSVSGLNAGVPARCQMSRSQLRFGSYSIMRDPRVG
jgi:hypothetical protein